MPKLEHRYPLKKEELTSDELAALKFEALEAKNELAERRQIAFNAIGNIERFAKTNASASLNLAELAVTALKEIVQDPLKSYYGPGNEVILAAVKMRIKEFLDDVKDGAMNSSPDALAMAFTYEAFELYEEACELYRYVWSQMDEKEHLAQEGEERTLQKLRAHGVLPE